MKEKCPRELSERDEGEYLSKLASRSAEARPTRLHAYQPDDFRTEFERDYTRIIHSKAFRRLRHKTQVFILPDNDHLCTRLEHCLHVASISRTISKALRLNNELVAAIAVGHDLGHAPFGHHGEKVLDRLAKLYKVGCGHFWHEEQSLRVVDTLERERSYPHVGLNLTLPVRDGIACHCGESFEQELVPDRTKAKDHLLREQGKDRPRTLEGCVVRCADIISYLGRDMEDGLAAQVIRKSDIPSKVKKIMGSSNREVIAVLIKDLYKNHRIDPRADRIRFSNNIVEAGQELKSFNSERIYKSELVVHHFNTLNHAIQMVFEELSEIVSRSKGDLRKLQRKDSPFYVNVLFEFLTVDLRRQALRNDEIHRFLIDFIAGMTDNFFLRTFSEMFRADVEELFSLSHGVQYSVSLATTPSAT